MKLGTLRAILRRNNAWERIRPDFKMLRVKDDKGQDLTESGEERLLAECRASISRVLFPAVVLGRCTGMRRDEVRLLQWHQIDLETGFVTLEKSKTEAGENRPIRLNMSALRVMTDWANNFPNRKPEHYVFPAGKYNAPRKRKRAPPTIYNHDPTKPIGSWKTAWTTARKRAGVTVRFHDLRHTAVTRMFEAELPLPTIAKCMGWSASTMVQMSKRYHHLSEKKAKAAFAALELQSQIDPTKKKQPKSERAPRRKRASAE